MNYYTDNEGKTYDHIFCFKESFQEYLAGWYFENETFSELYGPYETLEDTIHYMLDYFYYLSYGKRKSPKEFTEKEIIEMISMLDGAYEVVELFGHNGSPSQKEWSKKWLERAIYFGAIPE